jgi:hypothetical protein
MTRNHQLGVFHDSTSNLHSFLTEMCLPNEAVTIISPTFVENGNYLKFCDRTGPDRVSRDLEPSIGCIPRFYTNLHSFLT